MTANPIFHSLTAALVAERTSECRRIVERGQERPWTATLLVAAVMGGFGCLPLTDTDVAVRTGVMSSAGTMRVAFRSESPSHLAALEAGLARNEARQAEESALIADLELLTTEPAMVTVKPSGDTAEKNDTAGPLSFSSPLHGGSVVKPFLRTPTLQEDYRRYWARQDQNHSAGTEALKVLARYTILEAKGIATRQELEIARHEVERVTTDARVLAEQTLARWQTRLHEERAALAGLILEAQKLSEARLIYLLQGTATGQALGFDGCRSAGEWPEITVI